MVDTAEVRMNRKEEEGHLLWNHEVETSPFAQVLAASPNCKIVVRAGAGFDNIDLDACTKKGVVACLDSSVHRSSAQQKNCGVSFRETHCSQLQMAASTDCSRRVLVDAWFSVIYYVKTLQKLQTFCKFLAGSFSAVCAADIVLCIAEG